MKNQYLKLIFYLNCISPKILVAILWKLNLQETTESEKDPAAVEAAHLKTLLVFFQSKFVAMWTGHTEGYGTLFESVEIVFHGVRVIHKIVDIQGVVRCWL